MEHVRVSLPEGGDVEALRLQDLPYEMVLGFMNMPPGVREMMGMRLFKLAAGEVGSGVLEGMTFGELSHVLNSWYAVSSESEEADETGQGTGLDWSGLLG